MEMIGTVLNGDGGYTYFYIDEFTWKENMIEIDKYDGSLVMYGLCQQQISVIEQYEPARIEVNPNPSDGMINIIAYSETSGSHQIRFFSSLGNEVKNIAWFQELSEKDHNNNRVFDIDLSDLSKGVYFILFSTPYNVLSEKILLVE
jgi:hypothetical protein